MATPLAMQFEGNENTRICGAYNSSNGGNRLFSGAECDALIRWAENRAAWDRTALEADLPGFGKSVRRHHEIRLTPSITNGAVDWLPRKLLDIVAALNRQIWHFDITELSDLQLLRYDEGDEITLHVDLDNAHCGRKITVLTQLSPAAVYEGGVLEYGFAPAAVAAREQGSVLAFPSWVPHRVTPITSGRRYVLTCFVLGPSFR
jgi:PKHD-type hydroxylase